MSRTGRGLFSENGWSDENSDDEKQLSGRGLQSDTVIAHLYTSRLYNTHYITERNSIALAWDSPHLQRSWRDHPEMIRDLVISGVK